MFFAVNIFPENTLQQIMTWLTSSFELNIQTIIAVIGLAVAVWFITGWFTKSTKHISSGLSQDDRDAYEEYKARYRSGS